MSLFTASIFKCMAVEASGTLRFTLLLPDFETTGGSEATWVRDALESTYQACHSLLFPGGHYNFFGSFVNDNPFIPMLSDIAYARRAPEENPHYLENDFFANTILMQCVMAAYDTSMQLLLNVTPDIAGYTFANKLKAGSFNEWKNEGILNEYFSIASNLKSHSDSPWAEATKAYAKIKNFNSAVADTKFQNDFLTESKIRLLYVDITRALLQENTQYVKNIFRLYNTPFDKHFTRSDSCKIWGKIYKLNDILYSDPPKEPVDELYYNYRTEKLFHYNLANCLIQNIAKLKINNRSYPDGKNDLTTLARMSQLPNVFSRHLYLQFAFEHLYHEVSLKDSFFDKLFDAKIVMSKIDDSPFDIHNWHLYYEKYCLYFSDFIFPIYEWYFLLTLLNTIVNKYPRLDGQELWCRLQNILGDYINENHSRIRNPFYGEKDLKRSLLANYDSDEIIKPYFKKNGNYNCQDPNPFNIDCSADKLPNIAAVLSLLKNNENILPIPNLKRNFWQKSGRKNDRQQIIGQYIDMTINK